MSRVAENSISNNLGMSGWTELSLGRLDAGNAVMGAR